MTKHEELKACAHCGKPAFFDCLLEPHAHAIAKFMPDSEYYQQAISCSECPICMIGPEEETAEKAKESALKIWNTRRG